MYGNCVREPGAASLLALRGVTAAGPYEAPLPIVWLSAQVSIDPFAVEDLEFSLERLGFKCHTSTQTPHPNAPNLPHT